MKFYYHYFLLIVICVDSQGLRVFPGVHVCNCHDLYLKSDCEQSICCEWQNGCNIIQGMDSFSSGNCKNNTQALIFQIQNYCINSIKDCAQTFGCAFIDNECTSFSSCESYISNSNAQCQGISSQCTTDGLTCVPKQNCSSYKLEQLCINNAANSGTKQCKWIASGSTNGSCVDQDCNDAPITFSTQAQCQSWMDGCLATGQGCTRTLGTCSSYTKDCKLMIGSDGKCILNDKSEQLVCRSIICSDASLEFTQNQQCSQFLEGCVSNGKGCVSFLQPCRSYLQAQGCEGLRGSDGICKSNTIPGSLTCLTLTCSDAAVTLTTNKDCSNFLSGCITTGQGCTKVLGFCSQYTGTAQICSNYIGRDGLCKGSKEKSGLCTLKVCKDAPTSINTNQGCDQFMKQCLTTGLGCTSSLGKCSSYQGTSTTCLYFVGSDGNCTAPSTQFYSSPCAPKICANASKNIKTNEECQQYSSSCVTNGQGCIQQGLCEDISLQISCDGQSSCQYNNICLNRSNCQNYLTKSLCLQNKQQYQSGGQVYLRDCTWSDETQLCQNSICKTLSIKLNTDIQCSNHLKGCLTNGAGCVDVDEPCSSYSGTSAQCEGFRGRNGSQECSQLIIITDKSNQCVDKIACEQAKTHSLFNNTQANCNSFFRGCYFNGLDNCTNGDCQQYYGTQNYCGSIDTAISNGQLQKCWKTQSVDNPATNCITRECGQAPKAYNTDKLCNTFLNGCQSKGTLIGGCQDQLKNCSQYSGTLVQCLGFIIDNIQCSKTAILCRELICTSKAPPSTYLSITAKMQFCQQFKNFAHKQTCQMGSGTIQSCVDPTENSSLGLDQLQKIKYCYELKLPGNTTCGYSKGDFCQTSNCLLFTLQDSLEQNIKFCQNIVIDGTIKCGLSNEKATTCTIRNCDDVGVSSSEICEQYNGMNCKWNSFGSQCYNLETNCQNYKIPNQFNNSEIQKAQYCAAIFSSNKNPECPYLSSISTTNCNQSPDRCSDINIPIQIENNSDKIQFCRYQKISEGFKECSYLQSQATCSNLSPCSSYNSSEDSDVANQRYCQKIKDLNGYTCSFSSLSKSCIIPLANCSDYTTYGNTINENQQLCSQLKATNQIQCGANTSGVSNCKDFSCDDIISGQSQIVCSLYNDNCTFDGQNCILMNSQCSQYQAQSSGQGQLFNCSQLKQIDGTKCGWDIGNYCSKRSCSQLKVGQSFKACMEYASYCQYNGKNCINTQDNCSLYIVDGGTDQNKISICKNLISLKGKCTFLLGTNTCIDVQDNCDYVLPSSLNQDELSLKICSHLFDKDGAQCGFIQGDSICSKRSCFQAQVAESDSDCNNFLTGCEQDNNSNCSAKTCKSAPKTFTQNSECQQYKNQCVSNGHGCLDMTEACSNYYGTQQVCDQFTGNNIRCTNIATADEFSKCKNKSCELNVTSLTDADCALWYYLSPEEKQFCVWNGTFGCVEIQPCSQYQGTIDSCATLTATDGPCYGTTPDPAPCLSNSSICTNAPKTFNTDEQCKKWGNSCITNGYGCIRADSATCSSILSQACSIYKTTTGLFCDLAHQCTTKPLSCIGFRTASECNQNQIFGKKTQDCGWDAVQSICVELTCELLPITLTKTQACSNLLPGCTTSGAGCVKLGSCSSYDKIACGHADTTDIEKSCIWKQSKCRPIQCSDNVISKTDKDCNNYLAGCRTIGLGCSSNFSCSIITDPLYCFSDSEGYPCLWYKSTKNTYGTCIRYAQCTDVISSSHEDCQAVNKLCTTNGITCIGKTICQKILSQKNCIVGTDGYCGWLPAAGSADATCALYTACSAAKGTTIAQCQAWGSFCISNGTTCLSKSTCSSYTTQMACGNAGTDGTCFWVAPTGTAHSGTCRVQQCSDATTNITTHVGCAAFSAATACTTSGTACIPQTQCSLYTAQVNCIQGTDGVCLWVSTTQETSQIQSFCKLKYCQDVPLKLSSECTNAIVGLKCVSNGVNCVPQSNCSQYTTREACKGGGSDGACAFIPKVNLLSPPYIGQCVSFDQCEAANFDKDACNSRSDACYFTSIPINETIITQCISHTCQTKALASSCQPIPSWDLQSFQICVSIGTNCQAGDPISYNQEQCYKNTLGTHRWSPNTNSCQLCLLEQNEIYNLWTLILKSIYTILMLFFI